MSIDHPHGGGEDPNAPLIRKIRVAAKKYTELVCQMASIEGDVRAGGSFALFNSNGDEEITWREGECTEERFLETTRNAQNKCGAMHFHGVVCSGIVSMPHAKPPIYDGGIKLENGWYLAFSGLPPEYDRILCILIGVECELLEMPGLRLNTIMRLSPNEAYTRGILQSAFMFALSIEYKRVKAEVA